MTVPTKQNVIILLTGAFMLSACTLPGWMTDRLNSSSRTSENTVDGERRPPLKNPRPGQYAPKSVERPSTYLDAPSSQKQPTIDDDPYEYYNSLQAPESPKQDAVNTPESMPPVPAPAAAAPSAGTPSSKNAALRKPFQGNPSVSSATAVVAPIPSAPVTQSPNPPVAAAKNDAAPAIANTQADSPSENSPGWFGRMAGRLTGQEESPDVEASKKLPFPKLSTVPQIPEQMKEIRASQDAYKEELTQDHLQAKQRQQELSDESPQAGGDLSPAAGGPQLLGHMKAEKTIPEYEGDYDADLPSTAMPKSAAAKKKAAK